MGRSGRDAERAVPGQSYVDTETWNLFVQFARQFFRFDPQYFHQISDVNGEFVSLYPFFRQPPRLFDMFDVTSDSFKIRAFSVTTVASCFYFKGVQKVIQYDTNRWHAESLGLGQSYWTPKNPIEDETWQCIYLKADRSDIGGVVEIVSSDVTPLTVFPDGDNDTMILPLWYMQWVPGEEPEDPGSFDTETLFDAREAYRWGAEA